MRIAVASGKGGTGKTTVAVNLAWILGAGATLLDGDVEVPNAHLFLGGEPREVLAVTVPVPSVDAALCDGCGECGRFCEFHAISFQPLFLEGREICTQYGEAADAFTTFIEKRNYSLETFNKTIIKRNEPGFSQQVRR